MEPRAPTAEEKNELLEFVIAHRYLGEPSAQERAEEAVSIESNAIAVFDDYITDGPGYAGKVMVVVWGGSPAFTQTFIWERSLLPGEEHLSRGQIDWRDGRHEPQLTQVQLEVS
jgi:hypothetical protein